MFRRNPQQRKSFLHGLIFGAALMLVLILGWQGFGAMLIGGGIPPKAGPDFGLMSQAWKTIQAKYVDRSALKPKKLTYGAISGMVEALGDTGHSTFLSPQMLREEDEFTKGSYKGIGIEVEMKSGHVVIVAPFDGSPAQKAGLRPGEIILKVDGQDVAGLSLLKVVRRIAGKAGTQVTLTVLSPGSGNARDVTLTRATIAIHNVTWRKLPGTDFAQLRLASFSEDVGKQLRSAVEAIKKTGAAGIVLDLRDNPGGLLSQSVAVASQFLTGGNVLLEKNVKGKITDVPVHAGGLAPDIPMVVLINSGTASAAEILSGALQDAGRAKLIGEKTFGTGTVLRQFPLSDGSALLLAVQEWLTPKGRVIWHHGITPDQAVALPEGARPLFPLLEQGMTAAKLRQSKDRQLLAAIKALKGETR
ncbi:MAG TPA: S41 family peptidase [Desulfuromonadales bacterium]|nr:S41 family peptidase [Desulfuromonadales bacterium]